MKTDEIVVGLDIGTTKIAVIVGKKNQHGKIEILGYGKAPSTGVRRGEVYNIEQTRNSIKRAVAEAQEDSNTTIQTVSVGIAGQHIRSIQHKANQIRVDSKKEITQEELDGFKKNIYNIAVEPGETVIEVLPQQYGVDGETGVEPKGMLGSQITTDFHIVIAKTLAATYITRCINEAGYNMEYMMLQPLASAEAVLSNEEKDAGVVLVDIGGGTTDIAIFLDGVVRHTAVIAFGSKIITDDIMQGCRVVEKDAEELKIRFGSAMVNMNEMEEIVAIPGLRGRPAREVSVKSLAGIIGARAEEIIKAVDSEIERSGLKRRLIGGIVLTGGGAMLMHLDQLTQHITGMETRIGYPNEHLASNTNVEMQKPMYATAIGLMLEGIRKKEIINAMLTDNSETQEDDDAGAKGTWTSFRETVGGFLQGLFTEKIT